MIESGPATPLALSSSVIHSFQRGSREAFEAIYQAESPRLGRFIRRYVRSETLAEDIFQEIWVRAWTKSGQLRDPERFIGWFYQVARSCIFEQLRKEKRNIEIHVYGNPHDSDPAKDPFADFPDSGPNPRDRAQRGQWAGILEREMEQLDEQGREMIALRYGAGFTLREVAEVLDVPLGSVCAKVSRSLKKVRRGLVRKGFRLDS